MFVIFVRPDDTANVAATIRFRLSPAGPEPARLEQDLSTDVEQEPLVLGRLPVLPHRVGDVCADVLFLLAAKDIDDLAIRTDNLLRCRLRASTGRFPRIEGTAPAQSGSWEQLPGQSRQAVKPRRMSVTPAASQGAFATVRYTS